MAPGESPSEDDEGSTARRRVDAHVAAVAVSATEARMVRLVELDQLDPRSTGPAGHENDVEASCICAQLPCEPAQEARLQRRAEALHWELSRDGVGVDVRCDDRVRRERDDRVREPRRRGDHLYPAVGSRIGASRSRSQKVGQPQVAHRAESTALP